MVVKDLQTALAMINQNITMFRILLLKELAEFTKQQMKKSAPEAFGMLRSSIGKNITYGQTVSVATISSSVRYGYAEAMEEGFRPMGKFPPWGLGSRLLMWVMLKLKPIKNPERISYLVARAIALRHKARSVIGKSGKSGGKFYARKAVTVLSTKLSSIVQRILKIVF